VGALGALLMSLALSDWGLAQTSPGPPAAATVTADSDPALEIARPIPGLVEAMDRAEKSVAQSKDREEDLGRLRAEVEGILTESTRIADALRPRLAEVKTQIEKLGPAPAKDAPAEAAAIAAERSRLLALSAQLDGAIKTTELTWVRARQLIERITDLRHALFTRGLFQRLPSPLLGVIWRDAWHEAPAVGRQIAYLSADWWSWAGPKSGALLALVIGAGLLFYALRYLFQRVVESRKRRERGTRPSFFERAASIAWVAPVQAVPTVFAALILYGGLDSLDLLYFPADRVIAATLRAVLIFAAVAAIIRAVLAPREPDWRLLPLYNGAIARISGLLQGITAVFAADLALSEIYRWLFIPLPISVVQTVIASLAAAGLLVLLASTPFALALASGTSGQLRSGPRAFWLKWPLVLVAIAITAATLLGYVALGRFIAHQFVMTAIVASVALLLYLAIRAFTRQPEEIGLPVGELLEAKFGIDPPRWRLLARLAELGLTLLVLMVVVPFILLQWGFSSADIRDWVRALFFGFEVGQFRISLARILIAIALFMGILLVTRLAQRWMRENLLQPPRVDVGVANSVDTVIGYAGIAIAALLALSYAGFDITSLAIVAGALSVGIGFGLQSIVNNFVSGLILLIERPIKVGDWIVVKGQEGYVRRISVRATEIETFDRASLIVPNSELITGAVTNWTHRNPMGRVAVKVAVSYKEDAEKVREVLLGVAQANPRILRQPAPGVGLDNLGTNALEFTITAHVADINSGGAVQNELRFAILKTFRERGIEIAYRQHDVHLRDLDVLRQAFLSAMEERRQERKKAVEPPAG
jgi:small-conductance mechanosensitive channel